VDAELRRITRPEAGTLLVSLGGVPVTSGWTLLAGGILSFTTPPAAAVAVRAGFRFDVPVRFADDSLSVDSQTWLAGDAPDVPLIEVREA
jgi:uncharacterized protein (TIGR02217 family)